VAQAVERLPSRTKLCVQILLFAKKEKMTHNKAAERTHVQTFRGGREIDKHMQYLFVFRQGLAL
jgi:hypothetical protein